MNKTIKGDHVHAAVIDSYDRLKDRLGDDVRATIRWLENIAKELPPQNQERFTMKMLQSWMVDEEVQFAQPVVPTKEEMKEAMRKLIGAMCTHLGETPESLMEGMY